MNLTPFTLDHRGLAATPLEWHPLKTSWRRVLGADGKRAQNRSTNCLLQVFRESRVSSVKQRESPKGNVEK